MKNKADDFNKFSKEIVYPVFPLLAKEFLQRSGIEEGACIDIGTGPGYLGLFLAKESKLKVYLLDKDLEMLEVAKDNISSMNLGDRVKATQANVEMLPFEDDYAELIVSRGSIFFWDNQAKALEEIYRVLAPGGMTFIGGGFVTEDLLEKIYAKLKDRRESFEKHISEKIGPTCPDKFYKVLNQTNIPQSKIEIFHDKANLWIILKK